MAHQFTTIIYEKIGPIAKITMNRPEKLNAWLPITTQEFKEAFEDCQEDDKIRALIITGAGNRAFSSGEDVGVIGEMDARRRQEAAQRTLPLPRPPSVEARMLLDIVQKPVVAAINGICAGGGIGVAMASDVRLASENAVFHQVYIRRALVTSCEVWFLPRIIGLGPALQHILMGDSWSAQEAYRIGFVYKVVPFEKLQDEAMAVAHRFAELPPVALKLTKKAIYYGLFHDVTETMQFVGNARALAGPAKEVEEGVKAFMEKRKPVWK